MLKMNQYLKTKQASKFLGVSVSKLIKMDLDGDLVAYKMPGSKYRLYTQEQLENFLKSINKSKTRNFDDYAKTRLSEVELQEIREEAQKEFKELNENKDK